MAPPHRALDDYLNNHDMELVAITQDVKRRKAQRTRAILSGISAGAGAIVVAGVEPADPGVYLFALAAALSAAAAVYGVSDDAAHTRAPRGEVEKIKREENGHGTLPE